MIKRIGKNEIPECVEVIKSSFKTVADEFGFTPENAPRFTAFATTVERLEYQIDVENRQMYANYTDGKITGYYSLVALEGGKECEFSNLCVLPEYRHKQIGKSLLDDAFEKAKALGCSKMKIGIVEENKRLRKWYEENGFAHVGTEKFDFFPFTCGYMEKQLAGVRA